MAMSLTLQRPRERGFPGWVIAALIVVGPTLIYLVIASVGLHAARTNQFKNVTAADRSHVVTAEEVSRVLGNGRDIDPKREYLRKIQEDDGTLRLVYRFPDLREPADPFRVECEVVKTRDDAAAERSMKVRLSEVNTTFDAREGLLDGGVAGDLKRDGVKVGSFAVARRGQFILLVKIEGASIDDSRKAEALLSDKLEKLPTFGEPLLGGPK
jgi:hypothetical protein